MGLDSVAAAAGERGKGKEEAPGGSTTHREEVSINRDRETEGRKSREKGWRGVTCIKNG